MTRFAEPIPYVGYVASAVHAAAGNEDHAKRAAMKCSASIARMGAGVARGSVDGPGGAAVAAAGVHGAMMPAGHAAAKTSDDPAARAGLKHTPKDAMIGTSVADVGAGVAAGVGSAVTARGGAGATDSASNLHLGYRIIDNTAMMAAGRGAAQEVLPRGVDQAAGIAVRGAADLVSSSEARQPW